LEVEALLESERHLTPALPMNLPLVGTSRCDVRRRSAALPMCFRHLLSAVASAKEDAGRSNFPGRRSAPSLPASGVQCANFFRGILSPN